MATVGARETPMYASISSAAEDFRSTRRQMLIHAGAVLAAPALITGARAANEQLVLASYGGTTETFMRTEVIPGFEKETGIKVVYAVGTALSNYSRVLATRRRPEIDLYWANDLSHLAGKQQDLYLKLDPELVPNLKNVYPLARDADGIGVMSNISGCGLQYNPQKFAEAGFAPPTSWLDLWDHKFKGRVAIYSIGVLFSQDFLAMMTRVFGGNEGDISVAIRKIRELRDSGNVVAFANSPAEMDNIMTQGQAWVNYNAQTRALALMQNGSPLKYVQPKEGGTLFSVIFDAVKGSPNPIAAQKFINYMLKEDIQSATAEKIGYAPVNMNAKVPAVFADVMPRNEATLRTFVQLDRATMNRDLENWTEVWNREIETRRR
uniref:ABC transporter substrate-binding protein n=1 Tax=Bosea sp. NBC_00436 TaxID=2969620 RepID=A0A9E7ZJ72_9HYPH